MNAYIVILRLVWLLLGLTIGYDLSKWVNLDNYELSLLNFIPAFMALMVVELLYAKKASNGQIHMNKSDH